MPFIVQELIEDNPDLITTSPREPVQSALRRMIERDFSQLPIVDEANRPLGMITSESILRALSNFGIGLDKLLVEHARIKAYEFRDDADLFELLNRLRDTYAVLIVDGERRLKGIVTNYDTAEYFRRRAEDMMLVEDIEAMVREYIQASFATGEAEIDEQKLEEAVQKITDRGQALRTKFEHALAHYLTLQGGDQAKVKPNSEWLNQVFARHFDEKGEPRKFSDLTLYEYIELLLDKNRWPRYRAIFNLERQAVHTLLDKVRDIRNALAHFRGDITAAQRDHLRFAANWLAHYQDAISGAFYSQALKKVTSISEPAVESTVEPQPVEQGPLIPPTEDEADPDGSRYAQLAIWLQDQSSRTDLVKPTFLQIEEVIGGKLPESAYKHRAWWANDPVGHVQSQAWLDVGWRVASVNMATQVVRFARVKERQRMYIDFFSNLLTILSEEPSFPNVRVAPDGVNWHWVESVFVDERYIASFNFSFGWGNIFRVELYIDTGNKESNKAIFDGLHDRKAEIENMLGRELTWQRLNNRRASRVAVIHQGSITDSKEEHVRLREQAVQSMIHLKQAIWQPLQEVSKEVMG
jgi:CBS domain-containing protein